jgi:hypothetical protein
MSEDFKERRKYVRVYENFLIFFSVKGGEKHEISEVINISQGGMHFSANEKLVRGDEVLIRMKTPFLQDKIDLEGRVLEVREKIPGKLYGIHVEFQHVTPKATEVLIKIESWAKSAK